MLRYVPLPSECGELKRTVQCDSGGQYRAQSDWHILILREVRKPHALRRVDQDCPPPRGLSCVPNLHSHSADLTISYGIHKHGLSQRCAADRH